MLVQVKLEMQAIWARIQGIDRDIGDGFILEMETGILIELEPKLRKLGPSYQNL